MNMTSNSFWKIIKKFNVAALVLVKLDITKQHDSFFVTYEAFGSVLEGVKFAAFGSKNFSFH